MLEYDNNAFYYFALTFLFLYAIPGTWYLLSEVYEAYLRKPTVEVKARTSAETKKSTKLKKVLYGYARIDNLTFKINLGLAVFCWLIIIILITLVSVDGQVSTFDPFRILNIEPGASMSQIKKAYRALSLMYHPDKNPGDAEKAEMFMKIAKAYAALTDPTSRENFEKYGNPDGKQSLEVSIGLPSLLLDNPKVVLVLYLCGMIFFIPAAVAIWYANSQQYGEKNILYETYANFYQLLTPEHNHMKALGEIIAAAGECRMIISPTPGAPTGSTADDLAINKLYGSKVSRVMAKPRLEHPVILKTNILLHAHVLRLTEELPAGVTKTLDKILLKVPELVDSIVEIGQQRRWLNTCVAAMQFQQHVVQAIHWESPLSGFYQIPHITEKEVKLITAKPAAATAVKSLTDASNSTADASTAPPVVKTLKDYLNLSDELKCKSLTHLSTEQQQDIVNTCHVISNLNVSVKIFVEDDGEDKSNNFYLDNLDEETKKRLDRKDRGEVDEEEEEKQRQLVPLKKKKGVKKTPQGMVPGGINNSGVKKLNPNEIKGSDIYENDLVTLKVTMCRPDKDGSTSGTIPPVHAPYYPGVIKENLWVVLSEKPNNNVPRRGPEVNIYAMEKITSQSRTVSKDLKFLAPPKVGTYSMILRVFSDAYVGIDTTHEVTFTVKDAAELPEYEPHVEDVLLDNEPSVLEQMLTGGTEDDSSDEEEEEEGEKEQVKVLGNKTASPATATTASTAATAVTKPAVAGGSKPRIIVEDDNGSDDE